MQRIGAGVATCWVALLSALPLIGCGAGGGGTGDGAADGGHGDGAADGGNGDGGGAPHLGTAMEQSSIACPMAQMLPPGTTCRRIGVTCDGVDSVTAIVATVEPSTPAIGTIVLQAPLGGTAFLSEPSLVSGFLGRSLRVVELLWSHDWEAANQSPSIKRAACRPATALRWVYDQVHVGAHAKPFCGFGQAAGAAALAYSLAFYGLGDQLDAVVLTQGPAFARIDCGCQTAACDGATRVLCPELQAAPVGYAGASLSRLKSWEGAPTCGGGAASADELARWRADSVVSDGAQLKLANTATSGWFCAVQPTEGTGQAAYYFDRVASPNMHCVTQGCTGDNVLKGMVAGHAVVDELLTELDTLCVTRH